MISAATGAMALLMVTLVKGHGLRYLFAATVLAGILQLVVGYLRLGKLMSFVSRSVVTGFVNALAILILWRSWVTECDLAGICHDCMQFGNHISFPLIPGVGKVIPSPLVCILSMTAVSLTLNDIRTVGDMGQLPSTYPFS